MSNVGDEENVPIYGGPQDGAVTPITAAFLNFPDAANKCIHVYKRFRNQDHKLMYFYMGTEKAQPEIDSA